MKKVTLRGEEAVRFCRGLSLLIHAGPGLSEALFFMAGNGETAFDRLMQDMGYTIEQGETLSAAMEKSGLFSAYVLGIIRTGEYTGRLEEALGFTCRLL